MPYFPSTTVLNKTINAMLEKAKQAQMKNAMLTGIGQIYSIAEMIDGKLDLAWLGDVPAVRQWLGSKVYQGLAEQSYELTPNEYYDGFSIDRKAIVRDRIKGIQPRINQLAANIQNYKDELVLAALVAGTTGLAYDGSAFFANRTTNDNLLAGTGTTLAQMTTDLLTARRTMARFVTESGRYTRYVGSFIVCPTALEANFLSLKESTDDPNSSNRSKNIYSNMIDGVLALPDLDDANDWYLLCVNQPVKPLIYGWERQENGKEVLSILDDTKRASDGIYGYSTEMSGAAGYGMYEMAIKTVNT